MKGAAELLSLAPTHVPAIVTTSSGIEFDFMNPIPEMVDIDDIAHSLSNLCRYTGHCNEFYSVAQHSVMMAWEAHSDIQLEVLLHDAGEAYLGDIATPLKQVLPEYVRIERNVEQAIGEHFLIDIHEPITKANIKELDWRMLATECRALMPPQVLDDWPILRKVEPFDFEVTAWNPHVAYREFLEAFQEMS